MPRRLQHIGHASVGYHGGGHFQQSAAVNHRQWANDADGLFVSSLVRRSRSDAASNIPYYSVSGREPFRGAFSGLGMLGKAQSLV